MTRPRRWASAALLFLLALPATAEEDDWTLAKREDGVEVYTRSVPNFAVKEFRASAVIPAPMDEVIGWWQDPTTYTEWLDRCAEARRVEDASGVGANYLKFDFPFPASDRDVVLRATLVEESDGTKVFEGSNVDGVVPEQEDAVRISMVRSRWEFRAQGETATQVAYQQHMDPSGMLPAFILNRAAVDNPVNTLRGLIRYAETNSSGSARGRR